MGQHHAQSIANSPLRAHLQRINATAIQKSIREFRRLQHRNLSYAELQNEILKVLSVPSHNEGKHEALQMVKFGTYPIGSKIFRVRKIAKEDNIIPLNCLTSLGDVWNPPIEYCRIGRLNKDNESLLYTSPQNPLVAVNEMKITPGEIFIVIVYKSIQEIKCSIIGGYPDFFDITNEELIKLNLFHDFLYDEFTREVGTGTEHLYRISEIIAKDYFDLPPRYVQDAWCYPSVASKAYFNLCMRPDIAREKLVFSHVMIATYNKSNSTNSLAVKCVVEWSDMDCKFLYHSIGSIKQKLLAPDIRSES